MTPHFLSIILALVLSNWGLRLGGFVCQRATSVGLRKLSTTQMLDVDTNLLSTASEG